MGWDDYYLSEIWGILTYNGNMEDIQINYAMILLAVCCWSLTVLRVFGTIADFCFFTISCLYMLFFVQIGGLSDCVTLFLMKLT